MNWGYRITIFLTFFIGFILFLVFKAFKSEIDLVSKDYYQEELAYQETIDAKSNAYKFKDSIGINYHEENFELTFPKELIAGTISNGEVFFYSPISSKNDRTFPLMISSNGTQTFFYEDFSTARYQVKITFKKDGKAYQLEKLVGL